MNRWFYCETFRAWSKSKTTPTISTYFFCKKSKQKNFSFRVGRDWSILQAYNIYSSSASKWLFCSWLKTPDFCKKSKQKTFHSGSAEIGQSYKLIIFIPALPRSGYSALGSKHQIFVKKVSKKTFHSGSAEIGQSYKLIIFIPALPQSGYIAILNIKSEYN